MFITRCKFLNLMVFDVEVELNFEPKITKIDSDVEKCYFRKVNNKYFSPIYSISGANAKGKTSILKLLNFIKQVISDIVITRNDLLRLTNTIVSKYKKESLYENNEDNISVYYRNIMVHLLNNFEIIIKLNNDINKELNSINISNYYSYKDVIQKIITTAVNNFYNDNLKIKQELILDMDKIFNVEHILEIDEISLVINYISEIFTLKFNKICEKWTTIKHYKDEESSITIKLYDEQSKQEYSLVINDKNSLSFTILDENNKLVSNDCYKRIVEYFNAIQLIDFIDNNLDCNDIDTLIMNLVNTLSRSNELDEAKRKVLKIIQVADPCVQEIIYNNKIRTRQGIKYIELNDGSNVTCDCLSTGTIKWIQTINLILKSNNKNKNSLILIDEIDAYLHLDLVENIKSIMYSLKNYSQLIFTSHNYEVLSKNMSNKQIFFITEEGQEKVIKKVSSVISKHNSTHDCFIKHIVGSHPSQSLLSEIKWDLIQEIENEDDK